MSSRLSNHLRRLQRMAPLLKIEIAKKVIAVESASFHNENFRGQAYQGSTNEAWPARKIPDPGRKILIRSGRLRRQATRPNTVGSRVIYTLPGYGEVHNEGGKAGRGLGFQMPKRQFVGASPILKERFKRKIKTLIKNQLNSI